MQRNILTVAQFSERNPAFSQPSLRWLVFKSRENGLDKTGAVLRNGRRVLLDVDRFFIWLDSQQHRVV